MNKRGSTPILTNLVGVHPRNIHIKFEANPCSGSREEVEKTKKVYAAAAANDNNDDGHRVIARVTLTRWVWLKSTVLQWFQGLDKTVMNFKYFQALQEP